jgi:hypothetical protein
MGNDIEGSSRGVIMVISQHFLGGTEGNHENLRLVPAEDSDRTSTEQKFTASPLH